MRSAPSAAMHRAAVCRPADLRWREGGGLLELWMEGGGRSGCEDSRDRPAK